MLNKLLTLTKRRKDIPVFTAIFCALVIATIIIGINNMTGIVLSYLAVTVIFIGLTFRWQRLKSFLILTGASFLSFFVFVFLHNAIYGVFIHFFGKDFWTRTGLADEPFFFILAVFFCPPAFVVGAIGSLLHVTRKPRQQNDGITENKPGEPDMCS